MSTFINIAGKRYGRWLVLSNTPRKRPNGTSLWRCQCDCGQIKDHVMYTSLVRGISQSCGCLRKELLRKPDNKVHSQRNTTYRIWMSMKTRCLRSNHPSFKNYGGRGITICDRWMKFDNFLNDMGPRPEGMSLDRRDNDQGYCKENCRWTTSLEQSRNRRNTVKVEWQGKEVILMDVARGENVDYPTLLVQVRKGRDLPEIVAELKAAGKVFYERARCLGGSTEPKTSWRRKTKPKAKRPSKPYQHPVVRVDDSSKKETEKRIPKSLTPYSVEELSVIEADKKRMKAERERIKRNSWLRRCMRECERKGLTYRGPLPS